MNAQLVFFGQREYQYTTLCFIYIANVPSILVALSLFGLQSVILTNYSSVSSIEFVSFLSLLPPLVEVICLCRVFLLLMTLHTKKLIFDTLVFWKDAASNIDSFQFQRTLNYTGRDVNQRIVEENSDEKTRFNVPMHN